LSQKYEVPKELIDYALELDKVYIPARYPDAHPSGSPKTRYIEEEANRLLKYAQRIVQFCENLLSKI
jgi:HEPN domain-containing protein